MTRKDIKDMKAQLARALADGKLDLYRDLLTQLALATRP